MKGGIIVVIKEDLIYSGLPEERQQEIEEEALAALREENPSFESPRLVFMKNCLVEQKIRQLVMEKVQKGELLNGKTKEHTGPVPGGNLGGGEKRTPGGDIGAEGGKQISPEEAE